MSTRFPLERLIAAVNWAFAVCLSVPCAVTLYLIRTGQFVANWVANINAFAWWQELGILLALVCIVNGFALYRTYRWAHWVDTLLLPAKAYCAYLFLWNYAMSGSVLAISVPLLVSINMVLLAQLWSRNFRIRSNTKPWSAR